MKLPGTLWVRASTALQQLKKLPNLVCLSTLAGLGASLLYITPQLRHLFDQCATKHRHKAREAGLAALELNRCLHCAQRKVCLAQHIRQQYAVAAAATSILARCTIQ